MKYYTIQKLKAWEDAKSKGFLTGNKAYIDDEWFLNFYTWMMEQMSKRIQDYKNDFPVWVWLDTSSISFNQLLDDDYVLLEIELQEKQVLISNFEAWHIVLNNSHLDEENKNITNEQSWEYIFDCEKLEELGYEFEKEDLQGVVGRIDCKNIKVLKYIISEIDHC